jgi:hypothetical protein
MTDGNDIKKYAERGCPKAEDGIHVWSEQDNGTKQCDLCGALE